MGKKLSFLTHEVPQIAFLTGVGYVASEFANLEEMPAILPALIAPLSLILSYGLYGKWEQDRVDDQFHKDLAGCTNRIRNFGQLLFKVAGGLCTGAIMPEIINVADRIIEVVN